MTRIRHDHGAISLELAILAVPALLVLSLLVGIGTFSAARLNVDAAAQDAARAATLERTAAAANIAAARAASTTFRNSNVRCSPLSIRTDVSNFRPGGSVTVRLSCPTGSRTLGLPLRRTFTATATAPVDRYRGVR